ncbi:MarR family transcriptional regulator [Mycolicibacterium hippocampi]|uniref:Transcriptional regulator, MarR family n=1 Tax=Mycolicibacterium hippocampi TaxID=659824 RepID=A0A850PXV6_9MYCO|nr:MarR family transcriptional regulator [Mycolicibacterium hippocampi]NVN53283.1 Transcriptional regulator, MarR family [Mycolicibacterium hippocampi]
MEDSHTQPLDSVLLACRELWSAMESFDEAACRSLGIGRSDLRALNMLENGPLSAAALADRLALTRGSVTALVDRLESAELVARQPDPQDRRSVLVGLQEPTWRALAGIYRPLGQRVAAVGAAATARDRRILVRGLEGIAEAFHEAGSAVS